MADFCKHDKINSEVLDEILRARETLEFPKFNSPHEGLSVIEEEFLELQEAVYWGKKKDPTWKENMKKEAIQLAAMAICFAAEVC